jgi:hypothetical protein
MLSRTYNATSPQIKAMGLKFRSHVLVETKFMQEKKRILAKQNQWKRRELCQQNQITMSFYHMKRTLNMSTKYYLQVQNVVSIGSIIFSPRQVRCVPPPSIDDKSKLINTRWQHLHYSEVLSWSLQRYSDKQEYQNLSNNYSSNLWRQIKILRMHMACFLFSFPQSHIFTLLFCFYNPQKKRWKQLLIATIAIT